MKRIFIAIIIVPVFIIAAVIAIKIAFSNFFNNKADIKQEANMEITSPFFLHNGFYPKNFTCDGKNINPPLQIAGTPNNAKSMALILRDPDAPGQTFIHWVIWNIPPQTKEIKAGEIPAGAVEGLATSNKFGYVGPCPPSGTHRYIFMIYALDTVLDLPEETTASQLEAAMKGHILGQDDLMARYR